MIFKSKKRWVAGGAATLAVVLVVGGWFAYRYANRAREWIPPYRYSGEHWVAWVEEWDSAHTPEPKRFFPDSTLARELVSDELSRKLMPQRDQGLTVWDPVTYLAYEPNVKLQVPWPEHPKGAYRLRTNSLGMREVAEPAAELPDLRVLVTGDSHTDGVCGNEESYANRLEAALGRIHPDRTIEVLNAGKGGFSFYSYLGTLEKFLDLEPDVFVVGVFGGNDFVELLSLKHFFERTVKPVTRNEFPALINAGLEVSVNALSQGFYQLAYFKEVPEEVGNALAGSLAIVDEIARICESRNIELVFVYLPPPLDAQPEHFEPRLSEMAAALELSGDELEITNRLADRWLAALSKRGIDAIDMRAPLANVPTPAYWLEDHHINPRGHLRIARELMDQTEVFETRLR